MWAGGKGADDVVTVFLRSNVDIQQVDKNGGTGKLTTFIYFFFMPLPLGIWVHEVLPGLYICSYYCIGFCSIT